MGMYIAYDNDKMKKVAPVVALDVGDGLELDISNIPDTDSISNLYWYKVNESEYLVSTYGTGVNRTYLHNTIDNSNTLLYNKAINGFYETPKGIVVKGVGPDYDLDYYQYSTKTIIKLNNTGRIYTIHLVLYVKDSLIIVCGFTDGSWRFYFDTETLIKIDTNKANFSAYYEIDNSNILFTYSPSSSGGGGDQDGLILYELDTNLVTVLYNVGKSWTNIKRYGNKLLITSPRTTSLGYLIYDITNKLTTLHQEDYYVNIPGAYGVIHNTNNRFYTSTINNNCYVIDVLNEVDYMLPEVGRSGASSFSDGYYFIISYKFGTTTTSLFIYDSEFDNILVYDVTGLSLTNLVVLKGSSTFTIFNNTRVITYDISTNSITSSVNNALLSVLNYEFQYLNYKYYFSDSMDLVLYDIINLTYDRHHITRLTNMTIKDVDLINKTYTAIRSNGVNKIVMNLDDLTYKLYIKEV